MDHEIDDWYGVNKYTWDDYSKYDSSECVWYEYNEESGNFIFKGDNGDGVGHRGFKSYDYDDDAARKIMGGDWHTPSDAEWNSLLLSDYFTWEWTDPEYDEETDDLVTLGGYTVTSKVEGCEGNSIFLPAAGVLYEEGFGLYGLGQHGQYWSSDSDWYYSSYAPIVDFSYDYYYWNYECYRCYGRSIRGVCGDFPVLSSLTYSNFQSAGLYYSKNSGFEIILLDSEGPVDEITSRPECDWFIIDLPVEFLNTEVDLCGDLRGANWSLYSGWAGANAYDSYGPYEFRSGTVKVSLDEEDGIITVEMDAVTVDSQEIKVSYSGTYSDVPNYMFGSFYKDE